LIGPDQKVSLKSYMMGKNLPPRNGCPGRSAGAARLVPTAQPATPAAVLHAKGDTGARGEAGPLTVPRQGVIIFGDPIGKLDAK